MRTTITLEPDVDALVRKAMRERGLTFRQAVNEAIRRGLRRQPSAERYRTPSFPMGLRTDIDWDKASHLAAELEDVEILRKLKAGR
ncbi:MAG TPA: hypothetical protein VJZ72_05485 [Candidatus Limnocylindrales bacterium]|nr:hypothetical protein [Candidatus Limnocylindrales bacterium]